MFNKIQWLKRLCKCKYDQEMTNQEGLTLQQRIHEYRAVDPYELQSIARSPLIDSIDDPAVRQQFYKQYLEIGEQASAKMLALYTETAEKQMHEYKGRFDAEIDKLEKICESSSADPPLTSTMIDLVKQRLANIGARLECLYKFKVQLGRLNNNVE